MQPTASNPTAVSPFTGRSDDSVAANHFESLYEKGAFDSTDPKIAAQQQAERDTQNTQPSAPAAPAVGESLPKENTAAAAPPEGEGPEYVNFDDYLQKAGLERESFLKLPVRVKDADIPLEEILRRAEADHDVTTQSTALAEKQKAFETQQTQASQQWQEKLKQAEALGTIAYQELVREYQSIDWNTLSQTDPARWAVLQTQYQQRNAQIQGQLQQIQSQQNQVAQQAQAKQAETLKTEQQKLLQALPEWRDEVKFKAAREQMTAYSKKLGFTDDELNSIFDHRYMRVLNDAAQWNAHQASKAQALQKVRAAPSASNPGARITRDPNVTQLAQAKQQFMKTRGRNQDQSVQANYFEQLARS
jgi:hypothetical protein